MLGVILFCDTCNSQDIRYIEQQCNSVQEDWLITDSPHCREKQLS